MVPVCLLPGSLLDLESPYWLSVVFLGQNKMGISKMRQVLARLPIGKTRPMSLEYPSGGKEVFSRLTLPWELHTQG